MTTSRQPWTVMTDPEATHLYFICDADGKKIGWFHDWQDADLVLSWQDVNTKFEAAQDKLTEVQNVLNGEY